jgi:hypothetical protein
MLYDLQRMDLGDWHPREIHRTAALRRQQELTLAPLDEWMLGVLEDGALPGTEPGHPRAANPTTLLQDAKNKVPRARDIGKMKFAEYLKKEWGLTTHGGVTRGYNFAPLAEMRKLWDKRFGKREWPVQMDWGQPSLGLQVKRPSLLDEPIVSKADKANSDQLSKTDKEKLLEMSKALGEKRPNETSEQANNRVFASILMRGAAEGDSVALAQLLGGRDLRDWMNALDQTKWRSAL